MFSKLKPEFLDIFGVIGFLYITLTALLMLINGIVPQWMLIGLLVIAIIGLTVDTIIVYLFYLRKK